MSVNHSSRSGGIIEISFQFSLTYRYVVCSYKNRVIEAILKHTQYTIFNIKKKITLTYPKSAAMGFFFQGTREQVRNSPGKLAISVRATEGLLYVLKF